MNKLFEEDILVRDLFDKLYRANKGSVNFQYTHEQLEDYLMEVLNLHGEKSINFKLKRYIRKNWIMCGIQGYIINKNFVLNKGDNLGEM